jgi:hypothetical protein
MSKAYHCDSDDCEEWTFRKRRNNFLTVNGKGVGSLHFCSWDCVLKFSAKFEPMEILSDDPDSVEG